MLSPLTRGKGELDDEQMRGEGKEGSWCKKRPEGRGRAGVA